MEQIMHIYEHTIRQAYKYKTNALSKYSYLTFDINLCWGHGTERESMI